MFKLFQGTVNPVASTESDSGAPQLLLNDGIVEIYSIGGKPLASTPVVFTTAGGFEDFGQDGMGYGEFSPEDRHVRAQSAAAEQGMARCVVVIAMDHARSELTEHSVRRLLGLTSPVSATPALRTQPL